MEPASQSFPQTPSPPDDPDRWDYLTWVGAREPGVARALRAWPVVSLLAVLALVACPVAIHTLDLTASETTTLSVLVIVVILVLVPYTVWFWVTDWHRLDTYAPTVQAPTRDIPAPGQLTGTDPGAGVGAQRRRGGRRSPRRRTSLHLPV